MKKPIATGALLLVFFIAAAQEQELRMTPAVKSTLDSLLKGQKDLPHVTVIVPGYTARLGRVYAARPDNMPVLVPDINRLEKMPGSHQYTVAPPSRMPNPLYPKKRPGQ